MNKLYYRVRWIFKKIPFPSAIINSTTIKDNNERLISLKEDSFFYNKKVYVRIGISKKLELVARKLKKYNLYLFIYDGYRTLKEQEELFEKGCKRIKKDMKIDNKEEIIKLARKNVAIPNKNSPGGHQTGGAVDISLCDINGNIVFLGTNYLEFNKFTKTKLNRSLILKESYNKRMLLYKIMEKYGFVNYPNEWWHYSYGDRMWAIYKFKKKAIYGFANEGDINEMENRKS